MQEVSGSAARLDRPKKCSRPGDILTRINGDLVTELRPAREVLDDSVGKTVKLDIERGGEALERELVVQDLLLVHAGSVTSSSATASCTTCRGSRRAHQCADPRRVRREPGYMLGAAAVPRGASSRSRRQGHAVARRLRAASFGDCTTAQRAPVRFFTLDDPNTAQCA
jgi:hypothetical protein